MKNRKVTLAELNALNPCRPAESFLGDGWSGTMLDILNDGRVSDSDKIWAVTKLFDDKHARLFAVHCAREALKNVKGNIDPRTVAAIDTAERFANGQATVDELSSAYSAAESAEESSAYSAAQWAAYSAARSAACSAACLAAYSAAYSAAQWAAVEAAWSAARSAFVEHLKTMITPEEKPKARFVKTNVKLGERALYVKVGVK
jgi:hypothetical protein